MYLIFQFPLRYSSHTKKETHNGSHYISVSFHFLLSFSDNIKTLFYFSFKAFGSYTLLSLRQAGCMENNGADSSLHSIKKQTPPDPTVWSTASGGHRSLWVVRWEIRISLTGVIKFVFLGYTSTSPTGEFAI